MVFLRLGFSGEWKWDGRFADQAANPLSVCPLRLWGVTDNPQVSLIESGQSRKLG